MLTNQETTLPTGFMVLHGNRLEDLRDLLVSYLAEHPLGPLEPEVILLQSNGMKHWLELALADDGALGICAATRMELPSSYLWQMYRAVLGLDAVPEHMPFDKAALLWRLVRLLPAMCDANPVYAPLKRYLSGDNPARKLYQLAEQLADVLDGYQSYRADWLADWADGRDQLRGPLGAPQPLPPEHAWQAQLWRDIRADVGPALMDASRASVHERFMASLAAAVGSECGSGLPLPGLPRRLIVFGISSLSTQAVQALAALGQVCQVMLLVQNPCQYFWGDVVEGHAALRAQLRRRQLGKPGVASGASAALPAASAQPLLASWGKQGRDYLHLLDGFDEPERYRAHWSRVDVFVDPAVADDEQPSQLAQLQSAIFNLAPPPEQASAQPDDGSLIFVTAHSAQRELEVLHDRLLAWLDADPALQPRDVMVMVPDMPAFAPHIHAAFGRFAPGQPRYIPFSVADTTPRQSPLVQALEQLLNLPHARLTLADWLSLFEVAAVRQRFGLDEAALRQVQAWLTAAGVRWGLDAAHRLAWGLPDGAQGLEQNTWAFGLRRLLLGYALGSGAVNPEAAAPGVEGLTDGALWCDTLAQPALSGLDAPLAAGLLDWIDAIEQTLPTLQPDQPPAQWGRTLQALVERFFAPADDADERAIERLLTPLEAWLQSCEDAALDTPLPLEVVREHWLANISEAGLQQRFFGGGVQFGTLMPMRSIPFKVICLLGMNDGAYPRVQAARDFDLMASSWRAGDRSRREDDRYLFLEALLSARDKLYISWQGHSAADNSARPPSVLVAQLLDHVNACWSLARTPQAQPLQPFSDAYFEADSGFQTYGADWEKIRPLAQVNTGQAAMDSAAIIPTVGAAMDAEPLTASSPQQALTLADLQRLLRQPVEVFFRQRLQVEFDSLEELDQEDEPFALNPLQQHSAGAALLQAGGSPTALRQLQSSGSLPLAGFGTRLADELMAKAQTVLQSRAAWLQRFPVALDALPVELTLSEAGEVQTLTGTLSGLWAQNAATGSPCLQLAERTGAVLQGDKSRLSARLHVLVGLWLRHLAACASGLNITSVQLGVDGQVVIAPMSADAARGILHKLAQTYASAWAQPLPLACKTAWAYLLAERQNQALADAGKPTKDPHDAAREAFEGGQRGGERAESAYLQRAFASYDALADALPDWAQALYGDLLAHVEVSSGVAA
ncbi:exodeoxyribonuclease V subunit gamma [Rhodoferax sp.]|uniref:exodeoxyribonuclease V subunit gamma n=1 Tax=Rhodoferax sp. TaxID=50421 RepID=UPI00283B60ED|nr:exodeoxyribonuclease V subunit gamma [Rhodoferax sp.]MDR3370892.1 exodeoxyribonuclease V subunit gamma [Rhodoferax sp.]